MSCQPDFPRRLRVGVVGVGSHAYRNVLPALHYLPVQLVAFCDANLAAGQPTPWLNCCHPPRCTPSRLTRKIPLRRTGFRCSFLPCIPSPPKPRP